MCVNVQVCERDKWMFVLASHLLANKISVLFNKVVELDTSIFTSQQEKKCDHGTCALLHNFLPPGQMKGSEHTHTHTLLTSEANGRIWITLLISSCIPVSSTPGRPSLGGVQREGTCT